MQPNTSLIKGSGLERFPSLVRWLAIPLLAALLVGIESPQATAQVNADFTGGEGTVSVDQYPGIAGNGWVDEWTFDYGAGSAAPGTPHVLFLPPLNGGGNYLSFGFASTSPGIRAEGALRRKYASFGTLDVSERHIIEFDVRVDSWAPLNSSFDSGNDSITLTSGNAYRSSPSSDATYFIRAQGDNNSGAPFGKKNMWGFFHGGEFASGSSDGTFTNYFPFSIGTTYHFKIEQDPPSRTYVATISDSTGTNAPLTTQRLRWRSYALINDSSDPTDKTTNSTILHFIGKVGDVEGVSKSCVFSLDSVHIAHAPYDSLPPIITPVSPVRVAVFHPSASGMSFTASIHAGATNTIPTTNIHLTLNGLDVTGGLVFGGNPTNRTVNYGGLTNNAIYNALITVSDQAGRSNSLGYLFDTFVATNVTVIEAENYNFGTALCDARTNSSSAGYLQTPSPSYYDDVGAVYINETNGYVDRVGIAEVDLHDSDGAGGYDFRTCDLMGTRVTADYLRPAYAAAGVPDYALHKLQGGEWLNYTHVFSNSSYRVYLRASCIAAQQFQLSRVTSDRTQPDQTTVLMGTFNLPLTASRNAYTYVPLTDATGNPLALSLNGEQTLRLTSLSTSNNTYLNFLLFVPQAGTAPPTITQFSPELNASNVPPQTDVTLTISSNAAPLATNTIVLKINGTNVTAGSTITAVAGGVMVSNLPPHFFALSSYNTVQVICGDTLGNFMTNQWSFHVGQYLTGTRVHVNFQRTPPVFFTTPYGYFSDYGFAFGDRGNGYSFGWNRDVTIDGREAFGCNTNNITYNAYMAYNTFIHLQKDPDRPAVWEITLPNGGYDVHVVAGDGNAIDSDYELGVEGTLVVSGVPNDSTCTNYWVEGTNSVTVTDGRLTLSSYENAINNKVCFIDIYPQAPVPDFKLHNPAVVGGNFSFSISTIPRCLHVIEYKNNLASANWTVLTNIIGTGSSTVVIDPVGSARFYRMRIP